MKKIEGMNFGVRFFRRGVAKDGIKAGPSSEKEHADEKASIIMQDVVAVPLSLAKANGDKEAAFHAAAAQGDCERIRSLVMEGVDLEARDESGRTALNIATQNNNMDAVKTLLAAREMRRMAAMNQLPDTAFFRKFKKDGTA